MPGPPFGQSLAIDSLLELDEEGNAALVGGLSKHVWDGIATFTGINVTKIVTVAAWGSDKVGASM